MQRYANPPYADWDVICTVGNTDAVRLHGSLGHLSVDELNFALPLPTDGRDPTYARGPRRQCPCRELLLRASPCGQLLQTQCLTVHDPSRS